MDKPNFTGTWTFDPARSTLQITAPDESVFLIDHREPAFRLSRTHIVGEARDTFSIDLSTDSNEEVIINRDDVRIRARAYWDDGTLVFASRLTRAGEEATNVVRYVLSIDRETIVAEERLRSGSLNYDNVWVLERMHSA
jgi:hypothetical protein